MKKVPIFLVLFCLLAGGLLSRAAATSPNGTVEGRIFDYAANTYENWESFAVVKLTLNGAALQGEVPGVIFGTRTMVPLRLLVETLGSAVEWSQESAQVEVTGNGKTILLTLGSSEAVVDGAPVTLEGAVCATAFFYQGQGYTMVPLRFVSEVLGCRVVWEQESYTASIFEADYIVDSMLSDFDTPQNPQQYLVALDAGHGGIYSGAYYENTAEKDLNLSITLKLNQILQALGYRTLLTRTEDVDISLSARANLANQAQANIFVSVHCNATEANSEYQGLYVYHYPSSAKGKALAESIQAPACQFSGAVNRQTNSADFAVLRRTQMPAVLVETGFMSCSEELARLKDEMYQWKLAQGIAQGIVQYLNASG